MVGDSSSPTRTNFCGRFIRFYTGTRLGNNAYSFNGHAHRPTTCGNLKPALEDDFILRWNPNEWYGSYGSGKNSNRVGSVGLHQLKNGEPAFCGNCSCGLSNSLREEIASTKVTCVSVGQVTFMHLAEDHKVFNPRITRFREDKTPRDGLYTAEKEE